MAGNLGGDGDGAGRSWGRGAYGQRAALVEFAAEMYAPLRRCDQRAKAQCYTRGLLLKGRRKSIQPMAERLGDVVLPSVATPHSSVCYFTVAGRR